jgi:hypothetical protein
MESAFFAQMRQLARSRAQFTAPWTLSQARGVALQMRRDPSQLRQANGADFEITQ